MIALYLVMCLFYQEISEQTSSKKENCLGTKMKKKNLGNQS
jgi:hypothetical protein